MLVKSSGVWPEALHAGGLEFTLLAPSPPDPLHNGAALKQEAKRASVSPHYLHSVGGMS
jgi:hypothetical protein